MRKTILVSLSLIAVFLFLVAGCKTAEEQGDASEEALIGEAVKLADSGYRLCAKSCVKGTASYKSCIAGCVNKGTTPSNVSNEFPALKAEVSALNGMAYDLAQGESFTLSGLNYKVTLSSKTSADNTNYCTYKWENPLWSIKPSGENTVNVGSANQPYFGGGEVIICTPVMIYVKKSLESVSKCRFEISVDPKLNNPYEWAMLPYFEEGKLVKPTSLAESKAAKDCKPIWDKIIQS